MATEYCTMTRPGPCSRFVGPVRYVAIGDSFTEGVGDAKTSGQMRGWADLVAESLATFDSEPVLYANLAVRGRLLEPIVSEQLSVALELDPLPTLLTLNGGGNNMLRPGCDVSELISLTDHAVDRCLRAGVRPVLLSGPDPSQRLPLGRFIHGRGARLTSALADTAAAYGITFVDLFHDDTLRHPSYWSADRIHLNHCGHRRVADIVLATLGDNTFHEQPTLAEAIPSRPWDTFSFAGQHLLPWLTRRMIGRSSGDGRTSKHNEWTLVDPGGFR